MKRKELGMLLAVLTMLMMAMLLTPCSPAWAKGPQVAAGAYHTVGLKSDGTVVAVGDNTFHQTEVAGAAWTNIVAVAAGAGHTVGLKSDGTVVAVGANPFGQTEVTGTAWTNIVAVAAGGNHTVGLNTSAGTVVAVGDNTYHQTEVTGTAWTNIFAVASGLNHTLGLKSDGTVVAVGDNTFGQTEVTGTAWTNIVAVAGGFYHTLGLKSDGTVVAVGDNTFGQTNVSSWTDIVAVAAGSNHTLGLKSDGTVVAVGADTLGQTNVFSWADIVAVAAGGFHTVGLKSDGTVAAVGDNNDGRLNVSPWQVQILDTDIKGGRGTQVILTGSGFGSKKGKVHVGTTVAKVMAWYNTTIIFQTTSSLTPAEYPIYVTPIGGASVTYGKPFIMKAPELQFVQASEGCAGDLVLLSGRYFGSKKGTVVLGTKSCSVSYWYMDPDTGESVAAFKVPAKMTAGHYNVALTNEAGSAKFPMVVFTVKSGKSMNTNHKESFPDRED